jgi:hypothetical protein
MKLTITRALLFALAIFILGGCAGTGNNNIFGVSKRLETAGRMTLTGANPLFDSENFEEVDLEAVLDPTDLRKSQPYHPRLICGKAVKQPASGKDDDESRTDERTACINRAYLAAAMSAFYDPKNNAGTTTRDRRNRVLDRLLASSEQRCGAYKQYLKAYDIHWETGLGVGTTILGAAGAIATGTVNSRAFSGLAAMLSGARSEIRQGVFSNLASFVIIPGIDFKRSNILTAIKENRKLDISDYTVQAALHDAALYHGACTLESGLEVAQESIKRVENPGLIQINKTLATLAETKQLAHMVDLANSGKLDAASAKVVMVDYAPQEIILAGGGKKSKASAEDRNESSASALLANFDVIAKLAGELKVALSAKADDAKTGVGDKTKLTDAATKLGLYLEPVKPGGLTNTLVSARASFALQASAIAKIVSDDDSVIRAEEIKLGGESDFTKRTNGLASITTKKAARDAFGLFGFAHLEQASAAPLKSLTQLMKPDAVAAPDFAKIDVELAKLAAITAPGRS